MISGASEYRPERLIMVGRLGAAWGILGWLRLISYTEVGGDIFNYQPWLMLSAEKLVSLLPRKWKIGGNGLFVRMEGIEDRDAASRLTNSALFVKRTQLPSPEDGEYYWTDILGCQVINTSGDLLGRVIQILATGVHDVLVVQNGDLELLVPFLRGVVVKGVDLCRGILTVDWTSSGRKRGRKFRPRGE